MLTVPLAAIHPVAGALAVPVVVVFFWVDRRGSKKRFEAKIHADLPLVVDLFRLTIISGGNVLFAMRTVAAHVPGPIGEALQRAVIEVERGRRISDALESVVDRTSEAARSLVVAVVAAERYGATLTDSLERLSQEVRLDQERRAEHAARRLSVQLLFPLAGCTLPAFALLTVAPLLAGSIGSLAGSFH